jgi:hypothetical protein
MDYDNTWGEGGGSSFGTDVSKKSFAYVFRVQSKIKAIPLLAWTDP